MAKTYLYSKETGLYLGSRELAPGERFPDAYGKTENPPEIWRVRQLGEKAYLRNGKWEYEPSPDSEVEPNQEIG